MCVAEYQGREQDFQHREEYHITLLEEKDSHYNALVKALKDRVRVCSKLSRHTPCLNTSYITHFIHI